MWAVYKKTGIHLLLVTALILPSLAPATAWGNEFHGKTSVQLHASDRLPDNNPVWGDSRPTRPVLQPGSPESCGMVNKPLLHMDTILRQAIRENMTPGAVLLVARKGTIVKHQAYGYAVRYADDRQTPVHPPVPARKDTIYDLASVSKIFTSVAVMKLYEKGRFELDDPVARYIPEFAQNGKQSVTIRQLLTHTSGFRSGIPLYQMGNNREERLQIALAYPLDHPPGTTYTYSDLNMITLGVLVERLSGLRLDQFVQKEITGPLHMHDTFYNPPQKLKRRIAATEYQPWTGRGLVWGTVHDENAAALDGVAGHAGVFSTARDLAVFAHMMLMDGKYGSTRILKKETVRLMENNYNTDFPGDDHGLGWELNQGWYMDALSGPDAMGHTGFTGTSLVINRSQGTIAILLTNRVHPTRETESINPLRREVARMAADAIPVKIPGKVPAWFSGYGDQLSRSLVASLPLSTHDRTLVFTTWHRIEPVHDQATVEFSADGRHWSAAEQFSGNRKDWKTYAIPVPEEARFIRFHYQTNESVNGRGWYIMDPVLETRGKTIPLQWQGEGWERRTY
ncbi:MULTISPECIES: serine hydrolase [Thermoactinomyces]|jgi:serine-type D-Ala-D-Ala carboxypeptidase|uniref:serine hydrolase n=1 Tax=Thermoactinomyces TaxID=2023 RepID=UPI000502F903|nr:beta-lactamase [Thermoactinomyces sp. Gus2-1]KYQ87280.1 serine hydrolase [Thermoactinomyces sp. AS95]MBH8586731.1 serine hydrolase [Thermoactinomyces sp. CICC 10520]MBI0387707.1 serine hydrolase [Thermoactinomyces sp. CICC 24227]QBK12503.1 serine hydrolase [Thermoactinomyces vulgaris]